MSMVTHLLAQQLGDRNIHDRAYLQLKAWRSANRSLVLGGQIAVDSVREPLSKTKMENDLGRPLMTTSGFHVHPSALPPTCTCAHTHMNTYTYPHSFINEIFFSFSSSSSFSPLKGLKRIDINSSLSICRFH